MPNASGHQRQCVANAKSTGERCTRYAMTGGTVCPQHGGKAPQVRASARRRRETEEANRALARLGQPVETAPLEALELLLWEANGNVAVLRILVAGLPAEAGADGIYARTYHQTGEPTGEAKPHVLVVMYNEERDRLAKLAAECVKLGIDERRVRLVESQARNVFDSIAKAMVAIPAEHREVFRVALAAELREIASRAS